MTAKIIEVDSITKSFSGHPVIRNLSFEVNRGEIVGFLGPNGCGKTTTIRLLNGVIFPDSGGIKVGGVDPQTKGDTVRKMSGVLTESAGLYRQMTGYENLEFFAK